MRREEELQKETVDLDEDSDEDMAISGLSKSGV